MQVGMAQENTARSVVAGGAVGGADDGLPTPRASGALPSAMDSALVEFLNKVSSGTAGKATGYPQPCSSFGQSSGVAEGGRALAHGGVSEDGDV